MKANYEVMLWTIAETAFHAGFTSIWYFDTMEQCEAFATGMKISHPRIDFCTINNEVYDIMID